MSDSRKWAAEQELEELIRKDHERLLDGAPEFCDGPESEGFAPGFEERCGQHEPGAKLDDGKIDMSLIGFIMNAMTEVCRVMHYGKVKYTRGGFLEVDDAENRYTAAMFRHYRDECRGIIYDAGDPFYDTEKGLPFKGTLRHDAQVAVNALFRLEVRLREEQRIEWDAETKGAYHTDEVLKNFFTDKNGVDHEI